MPPSTWMLPSTITAACLALVVAAACRWGRLSPAVRHALWLLVLIKLITPPFVHIPLVLPETAFVSAEMRAGLNRMLAVGADGCSESADAMGAADEDAIPFVADSQPPEFIDSDTDTEVAIPAVDGEGTLASRGAPLDYEVIEEIGPQSARRTTSETAIAGRWRLGSPGDWLLWSWIAGTGLFVLVQGRRLINLHFLRRAGHPATSEFQHEVAQIAGELPVAAPGIEVVPGLPTPALCACGPVVLLWPEGPPGVLSAAGRRAVILHELAHLKRRDHWVGWLELVAGCGWWWNPLFWYVRHQLRENAELACDAWVVARLPDGRRAYAEALIDVAQGNSLAPLSGVVLGVGDGSRKLLERRLVMIMRGQVRNRIPAVGLAAIALLAVATLPRWSIAENADTVPANAESKAVKSEEKTAESDPITLPAQEAVTNDPLSEAGAAPVVAAEPSVAESKPAAETLKPNSGQPVPADVDPPTAKPAANSAVGYGLRVTIPASSGSDAERLAKLEAQLNAVLAQLKALQAQRSMMDGAQSMSGGGRMSQSDPVTWPIAGGTITVGPTNQPRPAGITTRPRNAGTAPATTQVTGTSAGTPGGALAAHPAMGRIRNSLEGNATGDVESVAIIRTTYKLPKEKAESLAKVLGELLGDDLEIKVKGDALQITASADDQAAIAHLIRLVQRKPQEPAKASEARTY